MNRRGFLGAVLVAVSTPWAWGRQAVLKRQQITAAIPISDVLIADWAVDLEALVTARLVETVKRIDVRYRKSVTWKSGAA